jgi:hypothetical protein
VHGVAGQHGVDGCVRQGNRLGAAGPGLDGRQRLTELGQHRRVRLHRHDLGSQRHEGGGQLAGAGTEVKHAGAGRGLERPAHRGLGVVRAVLGVRGRCRTER